MLESSFARRSNRLVSDYEILNDTMISLEYRTAFPSPLRYSACRRTKPGLSINSAFCGEF